MVHHIRFYLSFIRISIIKELEFRANFLMNIISDFSWLGVGLFSIDVAFSQLKTIGGWTRGEVQLLLLVNMFFVNLLWMFVFQKMAHFSELVRTGALDFALTKPINHRFLVSFASVPDVCLSQIIKQLSFFLLIVALVSLLKLPVTLYHWTAFFVFIFLGFIIFYCLSFLVTTLNVWVVRLDNVHYLVDSVVDAGKNPLGIWRGVARVVVWIIPLGYTANFATKALLSIEPQLPTIIIGIMLAALLLVISEWFWRFAIRHYASASS